MEINILHYDRGTNGFELKPMKPTSGIQYVQNIFDLYVLNDLQTDVDLGGIDEAARKRLPLEELIRYNVLNPLHRYLFYSRLT